MVTTDYTDLYTKLYLSQRHGGQREEKMNLLSNINNEKC
jgi:hypothetical protein